MIHVALECKHFLIVSPKEFDNKLPDLDILEIQSYCPTCQKYIKIESVGSIRKEVIRITSSSEVTALKKQQPHLTQTQCIYILRRRRRYRAEYVITGILRNGRRFKPIYTDQPQNYNIWNGTIWKLDADGRRKKIQDIIN